MNTSSPTVSLLAAAAEGGGVSFTGLLGWPQSLAQSSWHVSQRKKVSYKSDHSACTKYQALRVAVAAKSQACPTSTEVNLKCQLSLAPQHVLDCLSALLVLQISGLQHVLPAALHLSLGCSSLGHGGAAPCHPGARLHATPSALFLLPPTPNPFVQAKPQTA